MNLPSALSTTQIVLYLAAVAAVVSAVITQFVQPLINRVPALAPTAPDPTLRNLVLRIANVVLSVGGVIVLAVIAGQLALTTLVPTAAAVALVALGAHGFYKLIPSPTPPSAAAAPTVALTVTTTAPAPAPVMATPALRPLPALPVAAFAAPVNSASEALLNAETAPSLAPIPGLASATATVAGGVGKNTAKDPS